MDLGEAKKIFMLTKKSENVSIRTMEIYHDILNRLYNDLFEKEIFKIEEVTANHIREFFIRLQLEGLKGVTIHQYYRGIKTFFIFLADNEYIEKNPIVKVKPPKIEKKLMRTFTAQEIAKMLNSFDKTKFVGLRNYCIFLLLFSTGMRRQEMLNLKLVDINITADLIRIRHGKGDKERLVPLSRTFKKDLSQYLKEREAFLNEKDKQSEFLFITDTYGTKMSISAINRVFYLMKRDLGLKGEKVSCHTWRHTFAKNYLLCGGDIFSLQKIMGHSNIATTKNYIGLNDKEIKIQHARFNPLDNKDWL